jgi:hypothetical protein
VTEDRYEHLEILIKSPDGDESWFDRISELIESYCEPIGEADEDGNYEGCTCGMESMGGGSGTLDQCYDRMRVTEKWANDVQADDLKKALEYLDTLDDFRGAEFYERLRKAAYWHDDFNEWLANLPDEEEE